MNVGDYLKATGVNLHALSMAARVSYTTLHPHVRRGKPLSVETAKRLQAWSESQPDAVTGVTMTAVAIHGLSMPMQRCGTDG